MLCDKPDLLLIRSDHIAHHRVVRAVVASSRRLSRHCARLLEDDFVGMEHPRGLHGHFIAIPGCASDQATSCDIAMLTPPSDWMRSAIASTSSLCSPKCLSKSKWS